MRPRSSLMASLGAVVLLVATAPTPADVYVVANPSLSVKIDDLKAIYSGDKELAGTTKIKAVDNRAAQAEFLSKVLMLNAGRYESLWTMKSFRDGLTAPAVKNTDAEVIAYVQATPGAIGYIGTAPPSDLVLLKKF
jgi:hypothetical protein